VSFGVISSLVTYIREDSFIIGVACGKKRGGTQKPENFGVLKSGGFETSSLTDEVYAYECRS